MSGGDSGGGVAGFVLSGEASGGVVGVLGTVAGPPLGGGGRVGASTCAAEGAFFAASIAAIISFLRRIFSA